MIKPSLFDNVGGTEHYFQPTAVGPTGIVYQIWLPSSGKQIVLKWVSVSVSGATIITLHFVKDPTAALGTIDDKPFISWYVGANGTVEANFIGANLFGGVDKYLVLESSNSVSATALAIGTEA